MEPSADDPAAINAPSTNMCHPPVSREESGRHCSSSSSRQGKVSVNGTARNGLMGTGGGVSLPLQPGLRLDVGGHPAIVASVEGGLRLVFLETLACTACRCIPPEDDRDFDVADLVRFGKPYRCPACRGKKPREQQGNHRQPGEEEAVSGPSTPPRMSGTSTYRRWLCSQAAAAAAAAPAPAAEAASSDHCAGEGRGPGGSGGSGGRGYRVCCNVLCRRKWKPVTLRHGTIAFCPACSTGLIKNCGSVCESSSSESPDQLPVCAASSSSPEGDSDTTALMGSLSPREEAILRLWNRLYCFLARRLGLPLPPSRLPPGTLGATSDGNHGQAEQQQGDGEGDDECVSVELRTLLESLYPPPPLDSVKKHVSLKNRASATKGIVTRIHEGVLCEIQPLSPPTAPPSRPYLYLDWHRTLSVNSNVDVLLCPNPSTTEQAALPMLVRSASLHSERETEAPGPAPRQGARIRPRRWEGQQKGRRPSPPPMRQPVPPPPPPPPPPLCGPPPTRLRSVQLQQGWVHQDNGAFFAPSAAWEDGPSMCGDWSMASQPMRCVPATVPPPVSRPSHCDSASAIAHAGALGAALGTSLRMGGFLDPHYAESDALPPPPPPLLPPPMPPHHHSPPVYRPAPPVSLPPHTHPTSGCTADPRGLTERRGAGGAKGEHRAVYVATSSTTRPPVEQEEAASVCLSDTDGHQHQQQQVPPQASRPLSSIRSRRILNAPHRKPPGREDGSADGRRRKASPCSQHEGATQRERGQRGGAKRNRPPRDGKSRTDDERDQRQSGGGQSRHSA
ncbi:unnamed protein product [Vitrella brassicaformis CCMP3155]|uniref:Uncharacterized protein n=1 Tax=Vitrella brassicaformis (strain CCMP3155) TaxID=1169540 RepID=A0A0G4ETF1_VITBC|nr:unnamed protein product [Vitrella brassicaformis CCMP3155]|eukprot:CEM01884.1 unnamed protein product [Vitrella brassicaformis CCMP3155]